MITIHKALPQDAEDIREVLRQTWIDAYSHLYSLEEIETIRNQWHAVELLTKQITNDKALFLVAKDEGKIIAVCNTNEPHDGVLNIQRLHVLPSYQRQGLGKQLMSEVFSAFPQIKTYELEAEKANEKALLFYEKLGFKKASEKTFEFSGVSMSCYVMEKHV
jgi:ribosomal protein S18 acetylase RimI-like enzyme